MNTLIDATFFAALNLNTARFLMLDWSERTIAAMGKRSEAFTRAVTAFFAMTGAILAIAFGGQAMWGMWIGLCFSTIPAIHDPCKEVLRLRRRLEAIENRLG